MVTLIPNIRSLDLPTRNRSAITLVEVLVAIFIMGVGLLALLTLFPLGALSMSESIKDDRAAAIAQQAMALSDSGKQVLANTNDFIAQSLVEGTDCQQLAALIAKYEALAEQAAQIESDLRELRQALKKNPKVQRQINELLVESRAIQRTAQSLAKILSLVDCTDNGPPTDTP